MSLRTLALRIITARSTGTARLLKVHDWVITKHLALSHDIKVVVVPIVVGATVGFSTLSASCPKQPHKIKSYPRQEKTRRKGKERKNREIDRKREK